ncbi:MAG: glycosyl transferase family 2 [Prevotella sp.]|nr:glycosyl transferase family 2 [Prevotella sp.]
MTITTTTLIICSVLLLLSLTTPLFSAIHRRPSLSDDMVPTDVDESLLPRLTIVLTPQGDYRQLDEHLPLFLTQDYPPGYDIIVVSSLGDSGIDDVLKRYRGHANLRTTFIPDTTRYMSQRKLAITLGVKAADTDWIVLCDSSCKPLNQRWLYTLAMQCAPEYGQILGYVRYGKEAPSFYHFERFYTTMYLFHESQHGTAYRTNCPQLLFRKSMFMSGQGYQGNLKYTIGEYDFLVNKYAHRGNTGISLPQESWMEEDSPSEKGWENIHVFYQEIREHLLRSHRHRLLYNTDHTLLHGFLFLLVAALAYGIVTLDYVVIGISIVSFFLNILLRYRQYKAAFSEYAIPVKPLRGVFYEWSMAWHSVRTRIRYEYADKFVFISHKV